MPVPAVRSDLIVTPRPDDDGILVYDPLTDTGHVLDPATAAVFAACDGTTERSDLAEAIARATDLPADPAIVDLALFDLDRVGLLVAPIERPAGVSRRTLIGGLALGAVGVALLPAIKSLASVSSAGAQDAMTVVPGAATTVQDIPVDITIQAQNVINPNAITFWTVTQPAHGVVTVAAVEHPGTSAVATYTPDPGYTGADSFTFTAGICQPAPGGHPSPIGVCPNGYFAFGAAPAAVTITVTPPLPTTTTTTTAPATPSTPSFTG